MTFQLATLAVAASGFGFIHCSFGCVTPAAAAPVVEVRDATTGEALGPSTVVIASHGSTIDTLRPVAGAPGRYAGRSEFPEGFRLIVTDPQYADFENDHDVEDTGGCGMGATTIYVRLTPAS